MQIVNDNEVVRNLENLKDVGKELVKRKKDILEILTQDGGLTNAGAMLDLSLLDKQINSLASEKQRLNDRFVDKDGEVGAIIPYDVPNFLVTFYVGPAYLAGLKCNIRFASIMKRLAEVWKEIIEAQRIPNLVVDTEKNGREFGECCIKDPKIKNFVIAGGRPIMDQYSSDNVTKNFDRVFIFGPTRPKALILDNVQDVENTAKMIVNTAMFNSGQLCALEKEVIPTKKNYKQVKEIMTDEISKIDFGSSRNTVGSIKDGPAFKHLKDILEKIKRDPDYKILVGGEINEGEKVISPTLVECKNGVDPNIDYFGPVLLLNAAAETDEDAVKEVKKDFVHGDYAYIFTDDVFQGYLVEGKLKNNASFIRINTNILSSSIDWPYGGFNDSFLLIKNLNGKLLKKKGNIFLSSELTCDSI